MPKLAANLSMLFNEVPFLERFERAAGAGFKGVEFLFPYDFELEEVAGALEDSGLEAVLFNLPPGDWAAGERGLAAVPGREAEFEASLTQALLYAQALECPRLHLMAGVPPADAPTEACRQAYLHNVRKAAEFFAPYGISVMLEPINTRDVPGYFLNRQDHAVEVLEAAGVENAALQMDLYHCQIVEGDLATKIRRNLARIGHFQIAGVPERHEPDTGELRYPYLFELIDSLGYGGWIGCEYRPRAATEDGLAWAKPYGIG